MQELYPVLKKCPLFDGIEREELSPMLACLGASVMEAKKGRMVFQEGDEANFVGIVLSGGVQIVKEDFYGNRSIMTRIEPAELFGESFACSETGTLPVGVVAEEDSRIMLIDCRRITERCTSACGFHDRMIFNLLRVVATKNLILNQKLEITTKRTTREKLMAYLMAQAKLRGSDQFTIPYDRQALADYLGVERSAMSAEISKMRKEGLIECDRSRFRLL